MENKLSLEGLIFQATKINEDNNVLTITLNRHINFLKNRVFQYL